MKTDRNGKLHFVNFLGEQEPVGGSRKQLRAAYLRGLLLPLTADVFGKKKTKRWLGRQGKRKTLKPSIVYMQPDREPVNKLAGLTVPGREPRDIRDLRSLAAPTHEFQ